MSGANAVYSLVAASHWGWRMVGTEALSRTASAAALRVLQALLARILKFDFLDLETTNNFVLLYTTRTAGRVVQCLDCLCRA